MTSETIDLKADTIVTDEPAEEAIQPPQYALSIDPLTVTTPQLAYVLMAFGYIIPNSLYQKLPDNIKPLFRQL